MRQVQQTRYPNALYSQAKGHNRVVPEPTAPMFKQANDPIVSGQTLSIGFL